MSALQRWIATDWGSRAHLVVDEQGESFMGICGTRLTKNGARQSDEFRCWKCLRRLSHREQTEAQR